ncbi:MAG: aminotransferase class I/II-fold pyridoxal phosphate-dependent enzyme, partial [Planctomycetales bacterium]|nr:aminotransferase class I/II-fold pyridoxal phosphate-dependent enzyme [Planctomycetales bacterium]
TTLMAYEHLRDRLILLDGWSKTYAMTGWRLGYSVWPARWVADAERLSINCHSCVNASAQFAGIAALEGPQDAVDEMRAAFERRRTLMADRLNALPGVRCQVPAGAFYAFPNIEGTGRSARDMQDGMLDDIGVAAIAGTSFGRFGEGFLRFSCANSAENIERAIDRMEGWLAA